MPWLSPGYIRIEADLSGRVITKVNHGCPNYIPVDVPYRIQDIATQPEAIDRAIEAARSTHAPVTVQYTFHHNNIYHPELARIIPPGPRPDHFVSDF